MKLEGFVVAKKGNLGNEANQTVSTVLPSVLFM